MNNPKNPPQPTCDAQPELMKARNIGDALAAALMGEYSRDDALGQWAADLKLPDNQELVDKLKSEGIPVEKWERIHAKVYPPNDKSSQDAGDTQINAEGVEQPKREASLAATHGSECPSCKEVWPTDCEQAIHAELYGYCIACGSSGDRDVYLNETVHERVKRLDAKKIHHEYMADLSCSEDLSDSSEGLR